MIFDYHDLFNTLQYLWCRDQHLYECERYRVQFALLFQIFVYSCSRPGAVVESSCHPNSNEVLTYGVSYFDLPLVLLVRGC